jgi:hypothetical protein
MPAGAGSFSSLLALLLARVLLLIILRRRSARGLCLALREHRAAYAANQRKRTN